MLANRAHKASARRLVSRPSNAAAHTRIGDGVPPHTMTHRSDTRISAATVAPRLSALRVAPRRPTSAASTSFANSASTSAASPSRSTTSTLSRAAATRPRARSSVAPSTPPPASWTCTTSSAASKRWPSTTACSSAASAWGLPSSPISSLVNTPPPLSSWEHREPLQVAQRELEHLPRHRQTPTQDLGAALHASRFESLGHDPIFGPAAHPRHPAVLPDGPLQRVHRLRGGRVVLGDGGGRHHATATRPG